MRNPRRELLRWQFDMTWSLFEYHLGRLAPEAFLWEPTDLTWTVRPDAAGNWLPDWANTEPDPVPVPTIGWVTWHIGWWWSTAIDHAQGRRPRERTDITWPGNGPATVAWLQDLRTQWLAVLDKLTDADLDVASTLPWQTPPDNTIGHVIAWLNAELMKNVAEIGQLQLIWAASKSRPKKQ
ncbi:MULTISPECIES: DinB family protein [unclassified Streptomyces]|uniref:DinB family protein n=1 Tax=unclassified Streptomyces TaxID=2593676 RepID=UPI002E769032|nr:DinB family protein [Streptomyces sp. JV184]MEE1743815.1 DinB family protein [Streptomyces sp. JV184]